MTPESAISAAGVLPDLAAAVVREARRTGLPLAVACVMLEKESAGGRNVWGHDKTKCPDDTLPYRKGGSVTEQNYRAYLSVRTRCGMQGVGPTQLTYYTFQDMADKRGGCWRPEVNIAIGFEILAGYVKSDGVRDAFSRYNTGRPGDTPYGRDAMKRLPRWEQVVDRAGSGDGGGDRPVLRLGSRDSAPGGPVHRLQRILNEVLT